MSTSIFFKFSDVHLVHTLKWLTPADRAPFQLHAGAQTVHGTTKLVAGQASVTIRGHGMCQAKNAEANHCIIII